MTVEGAAKNDVEGPVTAGARNQRAGSGAHAAPLTQLKLGARGCGTGQDAIVAADGRTLAMKCNERDRSTVQLTRAPTFGRDELVKALGEKAALDPATAKDMVEAFLEVVSDTLAAGEAVTLSGFGVFRLRDKPARTARNPKTGVVAPISARRVVTFHASPLLRERVERTVFASM